MDTVKDLDEVFEFSENSIDLFFLAKLYSLFDQALHDAKFSDTTTDSPSLYRHYTTLAHTFQASLRPLIEEQLTPRLDLSKVSNRVFLSANIGAFLIVLHTLIDHLEKPEPLDDDIIDEFQELFTSLCPPLIDDLNEMLRARPQELRRRTRQAAKIFIELLERLEGNSARRESDRHARLASAIEIEASTLDRTLAFLGEEIASLTTIEHFSPDAARDKIASLVTHLAWGRLSMIERDRHALQ